MAYPGFQREGCLRSGPIQKWGGGSSGPIYEKWGGGGGGALQVRYTKSEEGGGGFRSDIRKVGRGEGLQVRYTKSGGGGALQVRYTKSGGGGGGAIPLQVRYLWAHRKYLHVPTLGRYM